MRETEDVDGKCVRPQGLHHRPATGAAHSKTARKAKDSKAGLAEHAAGFGRQREPREEPRVQLIQLRREVQDRSNEPEIDEGKAGNSPTGSEERSDARETGAASAAKDELAESGNHGRLRQAVRN